MKTKIKTVARWMLRASDVVERIVKTICLAIGIGGLCTCVFMFADIVQGRIPEHFTYRETIIIMGTTIGYFISGGMALGAWFVAGKLVDRFLPIKPKDDKPTNPPLQVYNDSRHNP